MLIFGSLVEGFLVTAGGQKSVVALSAYTVLHLSLVQPLAL